MPSNAGRHLTTMTVTRHLTAQTQGRRRVMQPEMRLGYWGSMRSMSPGEKLGPIKDHFGRRQDVFQSLNLISSKDKKCCHNPTLIGIVPVFISGFLS